MIFAIHNFCNNNITKNHSSEPKLIIKWNFYYNGKPVKVTILVGYRKMIY